MRDLNRSEPQPFIKTAEGELQAIKFRRLCAAWENRVADEAIHRDEPFKGNAAGSELAAAPVKIG